MKGSIIKSGILLLLITHFSAFLQAQENLYVHQKNGIQESYILETIEKLTFPDDNILITFKNGYSANYLLSEVQYVNFKYIPDLTSNSFSKYDSNTVRVFPNPTRNELNIVGAIPIYEIIVFDVLGQKLAQVGASSDKTILSLGNYPAGCYLLQIRTSEGVMSEKIMKN